MLRKTHMAIGLCSTSVFIRDPKDFVLAGVFAVLGSLIPDIDAPSANPFKRLEYIVITTVASLIYMYFTNNVIPFIIFAGLIIYGSSTVHRTFTHSPIALFAFSSCIYFIDSVVAIYFFIGYSLHLICDSLTPKGIPLLYPFKQDYYSLNKIKTGSDNDKVLGYLGLLIYLCYFTSV